MKFVVVLCLALFAAAVLADTGDVECYKRSVKCVNSGSACSATVDTNQHTASGSACKSGSYCNITTSSNTNGVLSYTGNCIGEKAAGASCSGSDVCVDGYDCIDGKCSLEYSVVGSGAKCDSTNLCQATYFCGSDGTCQAAGAAGANCTATSYHCIPGYYCNTDSFTCIAFFVGKSGDKCSVTANCDVGLYCNSGSCASTATSSNADCDDSGNSTSCSNGESCIPTGKCNANFYEAGKCTAVGVTSDIKKKEQAFWNCQNKNINNVCEDPWTCKDCTDQACDLGVWGDLYDKGDCGGGFCSSASMVAASIFLIIAADRKSVV